MFSFRRINGIFQSANFNFEVPGRTSRRAHWTSRDWSEFCDLEISILTGRFELILFQKRMKT